MGSLCEAKEYHRDFKPFDTYWHPNWPELLKRYRDRKDGRTEWACFGEDKLEFVLNNPQEVSETIATFPNMYARGPSPAQKIAMS